MTISDSNYQSDTSIFSRHSTIIHWNSFSVHTHTIFKYKYYYIIDLDTLTACKPNNQLFVIGVANNMNKLKNHKIHDYSELIRWCADHK